MKERPKEETPRFSFPEPWDLCNSEWSPSSKFLSSHTFTHHPPTHLSTHPPTYPLVFLPFFLSPFFLPPSLPLSFLPVCLPSFTPSFLPSFLIFLLQNLCICYVPTTVPDPSPSLLGSIVYWVRQSCTQLLKHSCRTYVNGFLPRTHLWIFSCSPPGFTFPPLPRVETSSPGVHRILEKGCPFAVGRSPSHKCGRLGGVVCI